MTPEVNLTAVTGELRTAYCAVPVESPTRLEVWARNPITGVVIGQRGFTLTPLGVAKILAETGYDPHRLAGFQVTAPGGKAPVPAEVWLEQHPDEALIAAWVAGTRQAAEHRQKTLHERWPALAKAIDNVQAAYEDQGRAS